MYASCRLSLSGCGRLMGRTGRAGYAVMASCNGAPGRIATSRTLGCGIDGDVMGRGGEHRGEGRREVACGISGRRGRATWERWDDLEQSFVVLRSRYTRFDFDLGSVNLEISTANGVSRPPARRGAGKLCDCNV